KIAVATSHSLSPSLFPKNSPKSLLVYGMEVSSSNGLTYDTEEKALKGLFDAFGSAFTLQEIAIAYCNSGRNADLASEFLYDKRTSTSNSSTNSSDGEAKGKELLETSYDNISQNQSHENEKFKAAKKKWRPVSGGSVSSVIGKDYFKPTQPANGSCVATKPLKLDSKELPMSAIWGEEAKPEPSKDDHLHKDMEDFLFKMLGEGFQLNKNVIREVLENCGFDMQKSMSKLLDQSAETLDERVTCRGKSTEKFMNTSSNPEGVSCQRKSQQLNFGGDSNLNGGELPKQLKDRNKLQKELWEALFASPENYEELPKRMMKTVRRSKPFGEVVTGPPMDFLVEQKPIVLDIQIDNDKIADDDENSKYQALRKAVVENRGIMKDYYKAAVDAFTDGDHTRASKLLEKGHFFHVKAREADEESHLKIFETRNVETDDDNMGDDDMMLDLHDHGAKEAIRLLKCHLSSLSGIPSMKYLKVILETNDADTSKGARRRLVMKLLEKESIEWIEEGNPGTILICLEKINPKSLSFLNK
ncbi:hypothetical protein LWI28_027662, partial [Acer negundo]